MKIKLKSFNTRFAPSPTGHMHLGHAFSAIFASELAKAIGGNMYLRIEDIDPNRSRLIFEESIYEDLDWLGIKYEKEVRRQSEHMNDYEIAMDKLYKLGVIYPCFCSRSDIKAEIMRAGNAPHAEENIFYPGTCRRLTKQERLNKIEKERNYAWRLNIRAAAKKLGNIFWEDIRLGKHNVPVGTIGDVVLGRKDILTSYHLSVTVDDHIQDIGIISRGEDLVDSTHIHKIIQMLLNLNTPLYLHHPLILDINGQRLSKRNRAQTLKSLKSKGYKKEDVLDIFGKKNILNLLDLIK